MVSSAEGDTLWRPSRKAELLDLVLGPEVGGFPCNSTATPGDTVNRPSPPGRRWGLGFGREWV